MNGRRSHGVAMRATAVAACAACVLLATERAAAAPAATIIRIEKRGGCLLFEPKRPVVRRGAHVYWVNETGAEITLRFATRSPFGRHRPLTIGDGGIGGGVVHAQPKPGERIVHGYASFPAHCPEIRTDPGRTRGPSVIVDGGSRTKGR
jgi:hypothetical protein